MNQYAIKMHVEWRFIQLSKILPASASAVMCQLAAFLITAACNAMHGIQNDAAFWNIHTFHAYTSKCNRRDWCGARFCQLLYKCSCLWLFSSINLCIFASFNPCQGNGPMQLRSKKLKHFPKTQLKLPTFGWVLWIWYGLVVPIEIYALACLLCVPYDSWDLTRSNEDELWFPTTALTLLQQQAHFQQLLCSMLIIVIGFVSYFQNKITHRMCTCLSYVE